MQRLQFLVVTTRWWDCWTIVTNWFFQSIFTAYNIEHCVEPPHPPLVRSKETQNLMRMSVKAKIICVHCVKANWLPRALTESISGCSSTTRATGLIIGLLAFVWETGSGQTTLREDIARSVHHFRRTLCMHVQLVIVEWDCVCSCGFSAWSLKEQRSPSMV